MICAWWTHLRKVPGATPIWCAVTLIPRPPTRYSLTASVRNSGVYATLTPFSDTHVSTFRVSTKAGQLQLHIDLESEGPKRQTRLRLPDGPPPGQPFNGPALPRPRCSSRGIVAARLQSGSLPWHPPKLDQEFYTRCRKVQMSTSSRMSGSFSRLMIMSLLLSIWASDRIPLQYLR